MIKILEGRKCNSKYYDIKRIDKTLMQIIMREIGLYRGRLSELAYGTSYSVEDSKLN